MTRVNAPHTTPSEVARPAAPAPAYVVNPTLDWDTDQARAERDLRRFPHTAGMSDTEVSRAAAQAVRRRQQRQEIASDRADRACLPSTG